MDKDKIRFVLPENLSDIEKARMRKLMEELARPVLDGTAFHDAIAMLVKVAFDYGECLRRTPEPTDGEVEAVRSMLHGAALNMHTHLKLKGSLDSK